jgi:hypothetical protein
VPKPFFPLKANLAGLGDEILAAIVTAAGYFGQALKGSPVKPVHHRRKEENMRFVPRSSAVDWLPGKAAT